MQFSRLKPNPKCRLRIKTGSAYFICYDGYRSADNGSNRLKKPYRVTVKRRETARANREAARKNPDIKELSHARNKIVQRGGKEMPQYAILRFAKQKGGAGALEAHHERTKEKYASNPDINIERSKYNFHIIKPGTSYKRELDNRIEAAGCKTRKDSVRFVDTLITASPDFFKGKKRDEVVCC